MVFPASKHKSMVAPGIGISEGEVEHLYNLYERAVLNKTVPILSGKVPKVTYMYLKDETSFSSGKVMGFLLAINEYAKKFGDESWRNPILRKTEIKENKDFIDNIIGTPFEFLVKPIDIITKAIGKGAKNVTDPITKPLIATAVIVGGGALIYGVFKLGLLKKAMPKRRK